jgi:hypothetical protein
MGDFKACYKPKAAECSGDVVFSMTFGTIENTIEYLCVEGYQGEAITKCFITTNSLYYLFPGPKL